MGAHIGASGQPVRQQLALDCQIPVIGGRGLELFSWSEGNDGNRAGKRRTRGRRRVGRERVRPIAERLVERSRRLRSVNLNSTECVAVRHHGREIGHLPGVEEHAGSAAQTGPAVAEDVPGESETRRKVVEIRGSSMFGSRVAELGKQQARRRIGEKLRLPSRSEVLRVENLDPTLDLVPGKKDPT